MPAVEIGKLAPRILRSDFNGKLFDSTELIGQRNLLLVFNRGFA